MKLGGKTLYEAFKSGTWKAYNHNNELMSADDLHINPHSIDVPLGESGVCYLRSGLSSRFINPIDDDAAPFTYTQIHYRNTIEKMERLFNPGYLIDEDKFILGVAAIRFDTRTPLTIDGKKYYFTQDYEGRSTMGRLGIMSHITAGRGDYGFDGFFTLEIASVNPVPVMLAAGMRIGQVEFIPILGEPKDYQETGVYKQHECVPQLPKLGRERFF